MLTAELERRTLHAVRRAFEDLNATFFKWQLRAPVFALNDAPTELGRWHGQTRTIELSRRLLVEHGWGVLVEVLKHEMAHQFVDEILGLGDEAAHGPAFRRICAERGFDARASGIPAVGAAGVRHAEHDKVLERVAKLLALAESPNEHEAQAAMSAAQRLMLKHNVAQVESGVRASYTFKHLGKPSGRIDEAQRLLACIIGEHFFVEAIWVPVWRPLEGKRGSVLEVCGTRENVELADYVYGFLMHTASRLWKEYQQKSGITKNQKRRTFTAGVMAGFREKLAAERKKTREQGIVWIGDPELGRFLKSRHPRVRWAHYGGGRRTDAYAHGRQAGQEIVLHRGVRQGPSKGPLLLPERRGS